MTRLLLVAAAALIDSERRILLTQRPQGKAMAGLWEFPGGKVEPGETPEAALVRELVEEVGLIVAPGDLEPFTFASHAYADFHLLMPLYLCRRWRGEIELRDVADARFVPPGELATMPMPEADLPLVARLREWLAPARR